MSKLIALDIGGVCIKVRPERCFGLLGYRSVEEIPLEILSAVEKYERGFIDEKTFIAAFRENTESALPDEFIISAWNAIMGDEIEGTAELVKDLQKAGHKIVLFSDTSPLHIQLFRERYAIAKLLPEAIYSFVAGAKKPEPAMFAAFEADHGKPDLYVDDRRICIDGGIAAGWESYRFTTPEDLRRKLESCHILPMKS